jgi:hypothetical protein
MAIEEARGNPLKRVTHEGKSSKGRGLGIGEDFVENLHG